VDASGCSWNQRDATLSERDATGWLSVYVILLSLAIAIIFILRKRSSRDTTPSTYVPDVDNAITADQQVNMMSVVRELEREKSRAEMETRRLSQQLASQSASEAQLEAMHREIESLQQKVADSDEVKRQIELEMEERRQSGDSSSLMQDSVIAGDSMVGSTKIESQVINDPEAIARAAIEAYRMAKNEEL
jgi:hypothetical protein